MPFNNFWLQSPALVYGLALLIGIEFALYPHPILILPVLCLVFVSLFSNESRVIRFLCVVVLFISSHYYVSVQHQLPFLPKEGLEGTAYFEISSLSLNHASFGKKWIYRGTIKQFVSSDNVIAKNISCTITLPFQEKITHPLGNQSYIIKGTLKYSTSGQYSLKVNYDEPWLPLKRSWSLAEMRYRAKETLSHYIHRYIQDKTVADFLTGIATGQFDNKLISFEFTRFGLQHIMAISGFHFAILALILSSFLHFLMPQKFATSILIILLTGYSVFLGFGASIERAWIGVLVMLCGGLMERQSLGINSLGIGLIVLLIIDPMISQTLGFQFSFLVTAAILFFFSSFDYMLTIFFEKRSLSQAILMNGWNQHGYIILTFFRQALALAIAVNVVTIPMTLYAFQKFQIMGIIYNLFFPFLVSISMFFLLLGLISGLLFAPLGNLFHFLNSVFTKFILDFTSNMPRNFDLVVYTDFVSANFLVCYLCVLFVLGIFLKHWLESRDNGDFSDFRDKSY